MSIEHRWDFFIAHAGPDRDVAESLYLLLEKRARTFLDVRSLDLGSDWDTELATAQARSRTTVVLVSARTPQAYYQREEIATAIALARETNSWHRLVPVFLDPESVASAVIPYGLRIKHGIVLSSNTTLDDVADCLLRLVEGATVTDGPAGGKASQPRDSEVESIDPWAASPSSALRGILANEQNLTSKSPLVHWKTAVLFARVHRSAESIEALEYGDRLGSANDTRRLLLAGFVLLRAGRHKEGEALLRAFLQQNGNPNKEAAIAFDLLGSELRRQLHIHEAEDRFKSALRLKRKVDDFVGQGITLGNLGRISLYSMRLADAVAYLEENVRITEAHSPEFEGIARNSLAEALVVADDFEKAQAIIDPILSVGSQFSERDRGFAHVVLAEEALSSGDLQRARSALQDGTTAFEQCSEEDGLFLIGELEGFLALANGWRIKAERQFKYFDAKLYAMADHLFSIYRWRRRAMLATLLGDEHTVTTALVCAKTTAIQHGLPSEEIEAELRELRKLTQGVEPPIGGRSWFLYWQSRTPRPVAIALRHFRRHPLGFFKWAEQTCEFLEMVLESALGSTHEQSSRRSFGQKVASLRAMSREWCDHHTENRSAWPKVIRDFELLVRLRNLIVHDPRADFEELQKQGLPLVQKILQFTSAHIEPVPVDTFDNKNKGLAGIDTGVHPVAEVTVRLDGVSVRIPSRTIAADNDEP